MNAERMLQTVLARGARVTRQGFNEIGLDGLAEGHGLRGRAALVGRTGIHALGDQSSRLARRSARSLQRDGRIRAQTELLTLAVEGEAVGPDPPQGIGTSGGVEARTTRVRPGVWASVYSPVLVFFLRDVSVSLGMERGSCVGRLWAEVSERT